MNCKGKSNEKIIIFLFFSKIEKIDKSLFYNISRILKNKYKIVKKKIFTIC